MKPRPCPSRWPASGSGPAAVFTGVHARVYVGWVKATSSVRLLNDAGPAWVGEIGAGTTAVGSGNNLTVQYNLSFKAAFAGGEDGVAGGLTTGLGTAAFRPTRLISRV